MSEQNSVDEQSKNQSLGNYRVHVGEQLTSDEGLKINSIAVGSVGLAVMLQVQPAQAVSSIQNGDFTLIYAHN